MDMEKIANSGQIFRMYKITEKRFELITGQHLLDIETLGEGCYAFNCDQMEYDLLIILHLQKILLGMITFYRRQKDMLGEFAFCIKIPSKC